MLKQQFKSLTKQLLLGVVRSLPRQSFDKFVYRFESKVRSKGEMGFYKERLVNYLNREIIFLATSMLFNLIPDPTLYCSPNIP